MRLASSHHGRERDGGRFGIGDEATGFVRFDESLLQVVERVVKISCRFGIVAALSGEVGLQFSDMFFHGKGVDPAAANLGSCGSRVWAVAYLLCRGCVVGVEAQNPGVEQMKPWITGVKLRGLAASAPRKPGRAFAVMDLAERGEKNR